MAMNHRHWLEKTIRMAADNAAKGEGPFAAIVVKNGTVVGSGVNRVDTNHDPTAHAELLAIRDACQRLNSADLSDCVLYASGEPCPMCMGAIYWAGPSAVYYACSKAEAAAAVGFPDPLDSFYADRERPAELRQVAVRQYDMDGKLEPFFVWASR